jgi:transposase InsO family protein
VKIIEETINAPENLFKPLSTLHFHLMREGLVFIGRSTFYKYAKLLCPDRPKPKREKEQVHFRASRVFEVLHIDTTPILTDKGIVRVAFVKDNKSKAILHYAILPDGSSAYIKKLLADTFEKHNLYNHPYPINIMSDGGSENKGDLLQWINDIENVKKIIAKKDVPFTNNMSESIHHVFKGEFMRYKPIADEQALQYYLDLFVEYYNHHRFPIELLGCSPMEVVNGVIPDKYKFKKDIRIARHRRYLENKAAKFCDVCC